MIAHWDEVDGFSIPDDAEPMAGRWTDLGTAAGSVGIGLQRIHVPEGRLSTPPHVHTREEEVFYVLGGAGLLWQGGATCELRDGDCVVHAPGSEPHTLVGGEGGLDVLAFGPRLYAETGFLPRSRRAWLGRHPVKVEERHPWEEEAELGMIDLPDPGERPANVLNLDDVEPSVREGETVSRGRRRLARAAGAVRTGLNHVAVAPGKLGDPPHCHSVEEELFVVLGGDGVCTVGDEDHPVHFGHVISRPPGTGRSHSFTGGDSGLVYLAYGTNEPGDVCWYPRSRKLYLRGVGVIGRLEAADYWDGED